MFGGDGSNAPAQFKLNGSYVSNFAPDISGIASSKALIDRWKKANPDATLGSFGPPAYLATQVALNAIKRACVAGKGQMQNRRDVLRNEEGASRTRSSAARSASRRGPTIR